MVSFLSSPPRCWPPPWPRRAVPQRHMEQGPFQPHTSMCLFSTLFKTASRGASTHLGRETAACRRLSPRGDRVSPRTAWLACGCARTGA